MVLQDEVEDQEPQEIDDPDFEEPLCYGSEDECGLLEEEVALRTNIHNHHIKS